MTWTIQPRSEVGDLAAIVAGDGPQVLLIHGVGLRSEAWGRQIDALSRAYKTIAVDLPGHGNSHLPPVAMALSDYADAIVATLAAPALVVGHSMGAMIALDMAIRYPDQVLGVVALNAIYERDRAAQEAVLARAQSLDGVVMADPTATLVRWFGNGPSAERSACRDWLVGADPAGYKMAYQVFAQENGPSDRDLAALACPALFVTGSEEPNSTPAMSRTMAALAPQGRANVIGGAAHMMPMTHANQLNIVLRDFMRGVLT